MPSMPLKRQKAEKNLSEDLKSFGRLPTKTKDLLILGEEAEKAIGKKRAAIDIKIKQVSTSAKHDTSGY